MRRNIDNPTQFQGDAVIQVAPAGAYSYAADLDFKFQNTLNATAQLQCDYSFYVPQIALAASQCINICQEFTDPNLDHVAWHFKIHAVGHPSTVAGSVLAFVCQKEDAAADTTRLQLLPGRIRSDGTADGLISVLAEGCVIRDKNAISGAEDSNNIVFGLHFRNVSTGTALNYNCVYGGMSIHPITKALKLVDPGV